MQLPTLDEVDCELATRSVLDFTTYTMRDYETNWHHRVMCEYLDKFARLEIKRLMIFTPPRYGKSELVSRRLPSFILGREPSAPIITASYGADLARRMNRDVQRIIDDPAYMRIFPKTRLSGKNIRTIASGSWLRNSDEFEVVEYNGYYRGAGVGGAITGMGMKYGIIDDPIKNRQDADSKTVREGIWEWYTSTFRTRLAPGGGILLTMTRWHPDGLEARLLDLAKSNPKADQWIVVSLPAIYEGEANEYDKRQIGEPLWPARYSLDELEATQAASRRDWDALYQQRPKALEGGMFKRHWFKIIKAAPASTNRIRYWDKAGSEGKGDWSVGVLMSRSTDGRFCIEDIRRGQWSAMEREAVIKQTAQLDQQQHGHVTIWQEQEPGSGGKESAENTVRNLAGFAIRTERVTGDKVTRADPFSAQCEAGNVSIIEADWNLAYLEEMAGFPNDTHDDQVDASSGAFNKLAGPNLSAADLVDFA